jgi:hypothetical protein
MQPNGRRIRMLLPLPGVGRNRGFLLVINALAVDPAVRQTRDDEFISPIQTRGGDPVALANN